MSIKRVLSPTRHAFNPMLYEDSVVDVEGSSTRFFYTPAAQRIDHGMEMIVAAAAGASLAAAWLLSLTAGPAPLVHLLTLIAFAVAGIPALSEVWEKLRVFTIDIDLLMLLGAGLAAYIGSPFEGALLLFLFALSGGLESFALRRTRTAITALRQLAPSEAMLLEGGETRRTPLRQVPVGAIVLVKPGEKVPLDGVIVAGSSSVDESAINGESIPRDCGAGDTAFAGTQNITGRLEVRVTKLAADTTLAKIVELVTKARHSPARAQRLIDRIGPTYSVIVIVGAVLVALMGHFVFGLEGNEAVRRGIAVLIVASPCALIIATPVAYLSAMAAAARRGVLVKGGAHLEIVARVAVIAFDKTGTLTTGRVRLTDVDTDGEMEEAETLRIAGALEASSTHPLARAVNEALEAKGLIPHGVSGHRVLPGEGETGVVNGQPVWIGRPERLADRAVGVDVERVLQRTETLRHQGKTVSAMAVGGAVSLLGFEDTIRDGSADCIERLRRQGVRRIDMLTGDHQIVAREVAQRLALDGFEAELSPEGKLTALNRLRDEYGALALVGDGINDAPALAHADAGIAMGSLGADVALEAADIVLMKDRIERVAWLHGHARRTAGIVRQNLTLAVAVISILSVFAALGSIPLPLAVIGHEGSTVLVALNALRLLRTPTD